MKRFDLRVPRAPNSTVTIDGAEYTIGSECFRGGTALCYSASRDGQAEHYVIKEIYPPEGAGRNEDGDVCSVSGNIYEICLQSFQNEIYLMENASSDTFQSWHYERSDKIRGLGVMRMTPKDTTRLDKAITEYTGQNHTPMERLGWALRITKSLLTGLHKLHTNARLLHLDLSLTNIFLSQDGNGPNAFFLDFGEARVLLNEMNVCSADSGSTRLFGAPERFSRATRFLTPAADTFSASVLFYHLLTAGSWAYPNQSIPDAAMLSKWDCAEVKYGLRYLELPTGIEQAVLQFLKKGMAYRSDRRHQTAEEMLKQIERLINIVSQKGIFRELILDRSAELYHDTVFYKIAPELIPQIPESESQHALYLGDGGSGKTTYLFTLWKKALEEITEDFSSPLPIFVSVSKFEGQDSNFIIDQILKHYVKDWDGGDEIGRKEITKLLSTESYVLLLDGLNESTMPDGLYQQIASLTEYPLLRIYAASRVPFNGKAWDRFDKINIDALSEEQVNYVLQLHQRHDAYNNRLLKTLRRPMFLAIYLGLDTSRFSKEICTPGEILDAYWEHLIGQFRDANHPDRNAALWKYALNTALTRFSAENKSLHFSDHQVNFRYPAQEILQVWKNCGLVRMVHYSEIDDREDYVFTHQNYRDFAVAKRLAAEMKEWNGSAKMYLSSDFLEGPVLSYLGDILGEYAYAGKQQLPVNSPVEKWMQEHLVGKKGPTAQIVVRNLIECMKYSRNNCITAKYDRLDLSLVRFYGCSLPKSTFREALLSENIFFSPGHRHGITAIAYHKGRQWIATASKEERQIIIWDRRTQSHIKTIETNGYVIDLAISEKADQMAWVCCNRDEVVVYNLQTETKRNLPTECNNLQFSPFITDGVLHFEEFGLLLHYTSYHYGHISWALLDQSPQPMFNLSRSLNHTNEGLVISPHSHHQGRINFTNLPWLKASFCKNVFLWMPFDNEITELHLSLPITTYAISPGNRYFACVLESPSNPDEGQLCLYDLSASSQKNLGTVSNLASIVATDEYLLASCVRIVDEKEPDGIRVIPGGIWELETGRKLPNEGKFCFDVAAVMNPEELIVGFGPTARILDVVTGKDKCVFIGHGVINYSANIWFLPRENTFFRAFRDGTVAKFSLDDRSCEKIIDGRTLKAGTSVPDADGHRIITESKDGLRIYSAHTGELMHHIDGDYCGFDRFTLLGDGNILVGESKSHSYILLWDIHGHTATVVCGAGFWAEVLELDVPGRYRKQIRVSVNGGEPVTRPIHTYDYPPHQRKEFILERNTLIRQEKMCRDDFGDPTLALLLVKERTPKTMTHVRDVHKILPEQNMLISGHYDGTVKLWTITPDKIEKFSEKKLCSDPIEQIALIPECNGFLAVSRAEQVYVCMVYGNTVECCNFWDAAPDLLHNREDQSWKSLVISNDRDAPLPEYRFLAELLPISKAESYIPVRSRSYDGGGVLLNHFSGNIIKSGFFDEYDTEPSRWLLRSRDHNTWVTWSRIPFMGNRFEVHGTATGDLRIKGSLKYLLNLASSAVSDDGVFLVVVGANGDMEVINTFNGRSFLWPKADTVDLCGCDFREAELDDHLRELLRMNGGIC